MSHPGWVAHRPGMWAVVCTEFGRPFTTNATRNMHPHALAKNVKAWRGAFTLLAHMAALPHLERIAIEITPLHKDRRSPQDVAACAPAAKAAIDGLVDAGVIDDDDPTHLSSVLFHQREVCGVDGLRVVVIDLEVA